MQARNGYRMEQTYDYWLGKLRRAVMEQATPQIMELSLTSEKFRLRRLRWGREGE